MREVLPPSAPVLQHKPSSDDCVGELPDQALREVTNMSEGDFAKTSPVAHSDLQPLFGRLSCLRQSSWQESSGLGVNDVQRCRAELRASGLGEEPGLCSHRR